MGLSQAELQFTEALPICPKNPSEFSACPDVLQGHKASESQAEHKKMGDMHWHAQCEDKNPGTVKHSTARSFASTHSFTFIGDDASFC